MVTSATMEAVMNLSSVEVVQYFIANQQTNADKLWQEYVKGLDGDDKPW